MIKSARKLTFLGLFLVFNCLVFNLPLAAATTSSTSSSTVTATVSPPPTAYSISIIALPPDEVEPGGEVTYTLTYSNTGEGGAQDVAIVAFWGFETDIVADYVAGSASNGYGGATPSVDLLRRTITWAIPVLPAKTLDQEVSFRLRTHLTHPYIGTYRFFAEGSLLVSQVKMVQSDRWYNTITYLEAYPVVVIPPEVEELTISGVRILEITAHYAKIFWLTNKPATSEILYGLSKAYGLSVSDPELVERHILSLHNLTPDTLYHFKVVSTRDEERVESEDFVFRTAKEVEVVPTIDVGALLVRAFNLRLLPDEENKIRLYPDIEVEFELPIFGRDISAYLILGGRRVEMVSQRDLFTALSRTPSGLGQHPVQVEVSDKAGNFFSKELINLVIKRLPRVLNFSGQPIERAEVTLYRFNPFINRFATLDLSSFRQKNPTFTNRLGEYLYVIPYGRYYLTAAAPGYRSYKGPTVVVLQNGIFGEDITLQAIPLGPLQRLFYAAQRFAQVVFDYLSDLIESLIVARLVEKLVLPFLFLSLVSLFFVFLDRFGLTPKILLSYFRFLIKKFFFFAKKKVPVWGVVANAATGDPLHLVEVKALSAKEKRYLEICFTNVKGEFGFILSRDSYLLTLRKVGFIVPSWEVVRDQKGKPILAQTVLFKWEGWEEEEEKLWLKPQEFPGRLSLWANFYAFLKSVFFTLADFILMAGLVISLLNLKFKFTSSSFLLVLIYLVLIIFWAILAFRKVKL